MSNHIVQGRELITRGYFKYTQIGMSIPIIVLLFLFGNIGGKVSQAATIAPLIIIPG